ncbi:unnamed protein product [Orchesella dallaii]|uniref:DUF4806 domain-containing protein n=1 Tax=Orchesella dallaii TaxID=48710 RepID=A0ABP1QSS9_9HEXA
MTYYCVVQFPHEDNAIALVSSKWITEGGKSCYWPSGPNVKISKLARDHADVKSTWSVYPCEIKKSTVDFEKAKETCSRNEYTSNLDTPSTEPECDVRKRRKRQHKLPKRNLQPSLVSVSARKRSLSSSSNSDLNYSEDDINTSGCPTADFVNSHQFTRGITPVNAGESLSDHQLPQPILSSVNLDGFASLNHGNGNQTGLYSSHQYPTFAQLKPLQRGATATVTSSTSTSNSIFEQSSFSFGRSQFSTPFYQPTDQHRSTNSNSTCTSNQTPLPRDFNFTNPDQHMQDGSSGRGNASFVTPSIQLSQQPTTTQFPEPQSRFEKVIVEYLVQILHNQKELLRRTADRIETTPLAETPVSFPLQSLSDYKKLIDWLKHSSNHASLVKQLSVIGGKTIPDITNRILESLFLNSFAENLSFTGRGKRTVAGIKGTEIQSLLYDSVRTTKRGETANNSEIDRAVQNWLKGAPDREGGSYHGRHKKKSCRSSPQGEVPPQEPDVDND